MLKNIRM